MDPVSETWEDLGYNNQKPLTKPKYKPFPRYTYEPDEITLKRKNDNENLIRSVFQKVTAQGSVLSCEAKGYRFDFWPATDCYYSYSKDRFGNGIQALISLLFKHQII